MSLEQEPTLGEILRGQARIEKSLEDFIEDQRTQNHAFRNAINLNNVAIALHAQKLEDIADLKVKMEGVTNKVDAITASANKIAGAWAILCVGITAAIAWFKHS